MNSLLKCLGIKLHQSPGEILRVEKGKDLAKLEATNSFLGYSCHRAMCVYVEIPKIEKTEALIKLLSLESKTGGMFYLHPIMTIKRYVH